MFAQTACLAALTTWRESDRQPRVTLVGATVVTVDVPGVGARTVSFDPAAPGDIVIGVPAVRQHALDSDSVPAQ